jgi:hypothetical protein
MVRLTPPNPPEPTAVLSSRSFGAKADGAGRSAVHVTSWQWFTALVVGSIGLI